MRLRRCLAGITLAATLGAAAVASAAGDAAEGEKKSKECVACHGETGVSASGLFPTIAGQYADYLLNSLKQYQSGARNNAIMAGIVANLTEEDMENLAAYYASQEGLETLPSR